MFDQTYIFHEFGENGKGTNETIIFDIYLLLL